MAAYSSSSGSSGSPAGTTLINVRINRVRDAAAALFGQSSFLRIEAVEVVDGDTSLVLDAVTINTSRSPAPFVVGSGKLRFHRAWLDAPFGAVKKVYVLADGIRIAELDVSGYSGTFNAIAGISVDGDSNQTGSASPAVAKPARARGARFVRLPSASGQPPAANLQDVVVFTRGATWVGTLDVDRQLERGGVQTSPSDPPGGAPVDGLPGPSGEFPQCRQLVITQADNSGTVRTRNRILITDGEAQGADGLRIFDQIDRRATRWNVNNTEVYGARLIEVMGNRVYLLAPRGNRRLWFCSATRVNGSGLQPHLNFNLSDTTLTAEERPNGGPLARAGLPPDEIVMAVALPGRRLFMGGTKSCSILDDDPGFGGQLREANKQLGVLSPDGWAFDGKNNLYVMTPEGMAVVASGSGILEPISGERVEDLLNNVDIDRNRVAMGYRADEQTIHVAITPRDGLSPATVIVYDLARNAFWKDRYQIAYGPTVMLASTGRSSISRNLLLCGFDGGIRRYIPGRSTDESSPIDSYVRLAPFESREGYGKLMVHQLQISGTGKTGSMKWSLYTGDSPEAAGDTPLTSTPRAEGVVFGRSPLAQRGIGVKQRGAAHQFVFARDPSSGTGKWEFSRVVVDVEDAGRRLTP